jgi:hypothetical protein
MVDWQDVHGKLLGIAVKRAGLDAEEARWLRAADELRLWRRFGMVSAADYMERVLGYAPRARSRSYRRSKPRSAVASCSSRP